jgi:predicted phage terminase large subunit-like protein
MNDYSACLTFLERDRNHFYLIDVYRDRLEFPELVKRVISQAQKFHANAILIEDAPSGTSLIQTVRRAGLQGVIAVKPTGDKVTRMYGQTAKLESGCLFLPKSAPWLADFLAEYLAFPKGRHDDQIDALSQFLIRQSNQEISLYFDFGEADARYLLGAPDPWEVLRWRGIR